MAGLESPGHHPQSQNVGVSSCHVDRQSNVALWWRAVRLLSGTKIADLTVWSILLFNPKDERIFVVEADYATIESAGGKWVPADRIAFFPIPIAEEGGTGS